ncbi:MAG: enoyl-CoA hydratase/isomerase family protein, partial [Pseudomonadota bacterium]
LTGARIGGADAIWAGLADFFVPSSRLDDLRAALMLAEEPTEVIEEFVEPPGESELAAKQPMIDRCFDAGSVEAILEALKADADPKGAEIAAMFDGKSPTSLKLSHRLLTLSPDPTIENALHWEFRASQGCMAGHDFFEGIRALLIDKDNTPNWQPDNLADVSEAMIEAHLAEPAGGDLPLPLIKGE